MSPMNYIEFTYISSGFMGKFGVTVTMLSPMLFGLFPAKDVNLVMHENELFVHCKFSIVTVTNGRMVILGIQEFYFLHQSCHPSSKCPRTFLFIYFSFVLRKCNFLAKIKLRELETMPHQAFTSSDKPTSSHTVLNLEGLLRKVE